MLTNTNMASVKEPFALQVFDLKRHSNLLLYRSHTLAKIRTGEYVYMDLLHDGMVANIDDTPINSDNIVNSHL